jgi:hypothetical protein
MTTGAGDGPTYLERVAKGLRKGEEIAKGTRIRMRKLEEDGGRRGFKLGRAGSWQRQREATRSFPVDRWAQRDVQGQDSRKQAGEAMQEAQNTRLKGRRPEKRALWWMAAESASRGEQRRA